MLKAPFLYCARVLPEHALAAAWRVNDYPVKILRQRLCQLVRAAAADYRVRCTHALNSGEQYVRARRHNLVRYEHTSAHKPCRRCGAFAAGRSAHIKHIHARLYFSYGYGQHSARLLHIYKPRNVHWGAARILPFALYGKAFIAEGNRFKLSRT